MIRVNPIYSNIMICQLNSLKKNNNQIILHLSKKFYTNMETLLTIHTMYNFFAALTTFNQSYIDQLKNF